MKYLLVFILIFITGRINAQITLRNILEQKYTPENVRETIIPKNEYHPYPKAPFYMTG